MKKENLCFFYYWNGPSSKSYDKVMKSNPGADEIFYTRIKLPK